MKPSGLRSIDAIRSRVEVIRKHFGPEPLGVFEDADEINRFKIDSDYTEPVEASTINRVLETIRSSINWGMAQTPPLFNEAPLHRFAVRLNNKDEATRDRRLL